MWSKKRTERAEACHTNIIMVRRHARAANSFYLPPKPEFCAVGLVDAIRASPSSTTIRSMRSVSTQTQALSLNPKSIH